MEVSEEFYNFAGKYNVLSFYESMDLPLLGSVVSYPSYILLYFRAISGPWYR